MARTSMFASFVDHVTAMRMDPDIQTYASRQLRPQPGGHDFSYRNGRAYQTASPVHDIRRSAPVLAWGRAVKALRDLGELGDRYQ